MALAGLALLALAVYLGREAGWLRSAAGISSVLVLIVAGLPGNYWK